MFSIYDIAIKEMTIDEPSLLLQIKMDVGRLHFDLGEYEKAMEFYVEALSNFEKEGIRDTKYGHLMHYIGSVFKR